METCGTTYYREDARGRSVRCVNVLPMVFLISFAAPEINPRGMKAKSNPGER